jgi:integrase
LDLETPKRKGGNQEVSLFKRGNVYWSYVWEDGIRHARSTGISNRRLAEQIDQKHKEEIRLKSGQLPDLKPKMLFAELAGRFLDQGSPKEWHRDRLKVLLPFFSTIEIGGITKGLVRRYRDKRHSEKQLTETTVNRDIECLRHLLYWAVDEGILAANPIARIRLERERRKKKPVLSLTEEAQLLGAAAPHLRDITIFALDTGMRRGEILNQTWEDVDFERRLLNVTHSKTPEGEAREIPLTERVLDLLSGRKKDSGLIFTFEGKPIGSLKTGWKAAIRRAGVRYIRFHYLRHTFNTRLLELSVPREVRMALLGHTFGDTHESYEHVELPIKREAIRRLEVWHVTETATRKEENGFDPQSAEDVRTASSSTAHSEDARWIASPPDPRIGQEPVRREVPEQPAARPRPGKRIPRHHRGTAAQASNAGG